jgi:hypothetical protein
MMGRQQWLWLGSGYIAATHGNNCNKIPVVVEVFLNLKETFNQS